MLTGIGLLLDITDELVGINLGRGLVLSSAWFKPIRQRLTLDVLTPKRWAVSSKLKPSRVLISQTFRRKSIDYAIRTV